MAREDSWIAPTAFVLVSVLAGGNAVGVRFSNRELEPFWGATLRFALAAGLMLAVMAAIRQPLPKGRALLGASLYGLFAFGGAFALAFYALVELDAGFGQILLSIVPLVTLMLAAAQRQERITRSGLGGAVVALVGMTVGATFLAALTLVTRNEVALPREPDTWIAVAYMVVIGSGVAFTLYAILLRYWTASRANYTFVLIPVFTVVLSVWLLDEHISASFVAGGALVLVGVYIGALRLATIGDTVTPETEL